MEKLLNKLERKYGRYAIERLTLYITMANIIGYVLMFMGNFDFLRLNPHEILRGQIWRTVTWLILAPEGISLFTIIMIYFYYTLGNVLERQWGAFRYNVYIFSGIIITIIGSILLYVLLVYGIGLDGVTVGNIIGAYVRTYYINISILFAFAATYPDMQFMINFLIPVKAKWVGILYGAVIVWDMFQGDIIKKIVIIISLLNFIIFYFANKNMYGGGYRRAKWTKGFSFGDSSNTANTKSNRGNGQRRAAATITKHKCAICGQSEQDNSELEFRFCSKCNGNYEYCNVHLFTHTHKQ